MPGVILRDDYNLELPEFQRMYIGDAKTAKDFDAKKALAALGSGIRIIADVDSTHSGSRVNTRCYPASELQAALPTWTLPYPRPFLKQHPSRGLFTSDDEPDVLGRIHGGKFVALTDNLQADWINPPVRGKGSGYILNSVLFSGRDAVEAIVDKRILTVSVGLKADAMICPICLVDWVPSMLKDGVPPEKCEHRQGHTYDVDAPHFQGKMDFYHVARRLTFDHIASTFRPAQPYASILGFKVADDSFRDSLVGETLAAGVGCLALCDEAGHVVRLTDPVVQGYASAPVTNAGALVLASMEDAHVLDAVGEFADGLDSVAIRIAIDGVKASGQYDNWVCESGKGQRLGLRGALPVMTDAFAEASKRFVDRYTGADKSTVSLRLFASQPPAAPAGSPATDGGTVMTQAEIDKMATDVLAKMGDLDESKACDDPFFQGILDADLFEKVKFTDFTDEQTALLEREELEREIDGLAGGVLDKALTAAERKRLPASAFCGPNRSFSAHDKSHISNGLSQLPKAKGMSSEQMARTKACLVSRAKKAGVEVSDSATLPPAEDTVQVASLEKEIADLQGRNTLLVRELKDAAGERDGLAKHLHAMRVTQVFDLRTQLKKPDVAALTDETKPAYLQALEDRTLDSLEDTITDLQKETVVPTPAAPAADPNHLADGQAGDVDNSPAGGDSDPDGATTRSNAEAIEAALK
jgi:hypothetical protein